MTQFMTRQPGEETRSAVDVGRGRDEDYSEAGITIIDINREVRWRGGKE